MKLLPTISCLLVLFFAACLTHGAGLPSDVLPDYYNREVTKLVEDAETLRLALGAAWDDAQACRAYSGYLRPWSADDAKADAEALMKRGAAMYELVKCIDDGTHSVRMARDTRDEPRLKEDIAFWRNELALAAGKVVAYANDATALKGKLAAQLNKQAEGRGMAVQRIPQMPWVDPQREAWRKAGPAVGVRLSVDTLPGSYPDWWNNNLSVNPYYIATKLATAGERFITPEMAIGAWGYNCTGAGQYDWTKLNGYLKEYKARKLGLLLELPTLQETKSEEQVAKDFKQLMDSSWPVADRYAPSIPAYLAADPSASLVARDADGTLHPHGGVQLFNPAVAHAYGDYLKALAADLKKNGYYDTIQAFHLERCDWAILPESVDYSPLAQERWQAFCKAQYGAIEKLNAAAGTTYASFADLPIPVRELSPRAKDDWEAFTKASKTTDANSWGRYLQTKYKTPEATRAALGDDYRDGYYWRLPFDYPPVLKIDYLHFRRAWVHDYLEIKRKLVQEAFPDKLIIGEMRQAGDHDGVQGKSEEKWGGFYSEDHAQWTGTGPWNETRPFMIRSVQPVGFGSRLSDSLESLYRDYLWLDFREASNLTRYFYDWVAHGYMDYQFGWQGVTNHWLTNQLLYKLGPTVANTAPQPQRIGLLFPRASYDLTAGDNYYSTLGWEWMLQAAKLPYTRVDEELVRAGRLAEMKLQLLVLPEVSALDAKTAAALAQWVRDGGTLLASTVPGKIDEYGRPVADSPLAPALGVSRDGTVSEAVADTPLTVTVPHGFYSGMWAETTDRKPDFETLAPITAEVLARYAGGKPAITRNSYGLGHAVVMGYPFGTEAVQMERTSIGFYRTYEYFAREPQLIVRTAWLRKFVTETLGVKADYGVDYAEVGRFTGREPINPGFPAPKGVDDPNDMLYVRSFGDPRPDHEMSIAHEDPDMAVRFFPRHRDGVPTLYLGVSTREVHYMAPRADVQMYLTPHTYHCRINNPNVQAIWDVARDVPVGFARDDKGVSFNISLPSGHIMMLAVSETPAVQLFEQAPFPGRAPAAVLTDAKKLAGGKQPAQVVDLTPAEILPWVQHLAQPEAEGKPAPQVLISYGQPANKAAGEKLAAFLHDKLGINASAVEQVATIGKDGNGSAFVGYEKALIFIGDEWTNNDLALHGAYWGASYTPHMPFTATYAWPGPGRAVISLSRRYALLNEQGRQVSYRFNFSFKLRPVQDSYPLYRRKLHIAGNGADAEKAVDVLIKEIGSQK